MRLRAATVMCSPNHTPSYIREWISAVKSSVHVHPTQLQLATTPFADWLPDDETYLPYSAEYEEMWLKTGIDCLSFGRLQSDQDLVWFHRLRQIIAHNLASYCHADLGPGDELDEYWLDAIAATFFAVCQQPPLSSKAQFFSATLNCANSLGYVSAANSNGVLGFSLSVEPPDWFCDTVADTTNRALFQDCITQLQKTDLARVSAEAHAIGKQTALPFLGIEITKPVQYVNMPNPTIIGSEWAVDNTKYRLAPSREKISNTDSVSSIKNAIVAVTQPYIDSGTAVVLEL